MDENVQKQMLSNYDYITKELLNITNIFGEKKDQLALMRLGVVVSQINGVNQLLDVYRPAKQEEKKEEESPQNG